MHSRLSHYLQRHGYLYLTLSCLLCLLLYKWTDFYLPFFWDELGVYGSGAIYMAQNGIGLLPASLPAELSRGHPLFFYAVSALFEKIAHYNIFAVHLCEFSVFVAFVLVLFFTIQKSYNSVIAAVASLLFMIQPLVIAQSGLVLPEMMLALFCWLSLWFYSKQRWVGYFAFTAIALLIKESAIILPIAVFITHVIKYFGRGTLLKKHLLIILSPTLVLILFFIIQKNQNGWYLFPYHEKLLASNIHELYKGVLSFKRYLLINQHRYIYSFIILLGSIFFIYKYLKKQKWHMDSLFEVSVIFSMLFFAFCSANAINERYILPMLAPFMLITAICIWELSFRHHIISIVICLGCVLFQIKEIDPGTFDCDSNESYKYAVHTELEAARFITDKLNVKSIIATFPINMILTSEKEGYPDKRILSYPYNDSLEYIVTSSPGPEYLVPQGIATDTIAVFKEKEMAVFILKRKPHF